MSSNTQEIPARSSLSLPELARSIAIHQRAIAAESSDLTDLDSDGLRPTPEHADRGTVSIDAYPDHETGGVFVEFSARPLGSQGLHTTINIGPDNTIAITDPEDLAVLAERAQDFEDFARGMLGRGAREVLFQRRDRQVIQESLRPPADPSDPEFNDFSAIIEGIDDPELCAIIKEHHLTFIMQQQLRENDSPYTFSAPFTVKGKVLRPMVVMLHPEDDTIIPRVYYHSASQLSWRWLPGLEEYPSYTKGQNEYSLDAPVALQHSLNTLLEKTSLDYYADDKLLRAICPTRQKHSPRTLPDAWHFTEEHIDSNYPYESLAPDDPIAPDFHTKNKTQAVISEVYGKAWLDEFHSNDGTLRYLMAHNEDGLAWLAHTEKIDTPLRPSLNPDTAVIPGNILRSPAYEYYANLKWNHSLLSNDEHPVYPQYADVFLHTLSQHPVIRRYFSTIPDEHLPWKNHLHGVRNWPNMQSIIHSMSTPETPLHTYADAFTSALQAVDKALPENDDIAPYILPLQLMLQDIANDADETSLILQPSSSSTDTLPNDADTTHGMFAVDAFDSPAVVGKLELLRHLGFTVVTSQTEPHDPTVTHDYLQSPDYPVCTYIVSKTPKGIMSIAKQLSY